MNKILLAAAAISMMATPALASVANAPTDAEYNTARANLSISDANNMGVDGPTITALLVLVAIIAAVIITADGDDGAPASP